MNYNHPSDFIKRYVSEHGVARNLFDVRSAGDVLFDEDSVAENRKVLCEQAVSEERPSFWRSMRRRFMRNEPAEQSRRMTAAPMPVSDEPSIEDMMSEVQILIEQLRQSGVGELVLQRLFQPTTQLSRMRIHYGRIFLTDYNNMEIKMHPLSKAIYLLFLRHPEGIPFSYLPDYRSELLHMYELISGRDSREDIRSSIDTVYDRMPIANVPDFNEKDYQPTDNTPLYDAMGNAITHLRRHIAEDDNVLVTIITDGYENSSVEWNRQQILQLVEELKKANWLFTYIGANQDALAVAKDMGIDHSMNFRSDSKGTKSMFLKEKLSRCAFYDKLAEGMHFSTAKSEKFFMDDDEDI